MDILETKVALPELCKEMNREKAARLEDCMNEETPPDYLIENRGKSQAARQA
jgi:hypothetical protein